MTNFISACTCDRRSKIQCFTNQVFILTSIDELVIILVEISLIETTIELLQNLFGFDRNGNQISGITVRHRLRQLQCLCQEQDDLSEIARSAPTIGLPMARLYFHLMHSATKYMSASHFGFLEFLPHLHFAL